jgi:hypothetical protein
MSDEFPVREEIVELLDDDEEDCPTHANTQAERPVQILANYHEIVHARRNLVLGQVLRRFGE